MADPTTSPVPAWKRYATLALLGVVLLVAAYVIYTKELHHTTTATHSSPPATVPAQPSVITPSVPTTIPGAIPISSRNPFQ
jgi:hypothetical protein